MNPAKRSEPAELTNTSRILLGLLRMTGESTGYEIKALVDASTEFFWPASYGRIYPELHRLAELGLVESSDEPRGRRQRKRYALTGAGERALDAWLTSWQTPMVFEFRHEGMLKLFLSDSVPWETALANIRAARQLHQRLADRLRELQPFAEETTRRFSMLTLETGINIHSFCADWFQSLETRLLAEGEAGENQAPPDEQ